MSELICSPGKPDIEVFSLYDGTVRVEYHDRSHRYFLVEGETRIRVPSITTILRVVDKSGPLVGWAVNCVLDELKQTIKPGAVYGEEDLDRIWQQAKGSFARKRNEAGAFGTEVHDSIQAALGGGPAVSVGDAGAGAVSTACTSAAISWLSQHRVRIVHLERPLYSRGHRVAGRCDQLAYIDDELSIVDWKTSPSIYPEYLLQTAAYAALYEEETGQRVTARWLVRLGRDGSFEAHKYGLKEQERDWAGFLAALELHRKLEEIRKDEAASSVSLDGSRAGSGRAETETEAGADPPGDAGKLVKSAA